MALTERMCGILEMGIRKERDAHDFYLRAAENTNHPLGKKMFARLADDETKHEQLLASWSRGGVCPRKVSLPATGPDVLKRAHAKIGRVVKPETGDLEAIELGQKMEREAIAFYQDVAERSDSLLATIPRAFRRVARTRRHNPLQSQGVGHSAR